jgi:hypothetical protein
MARTNPPVVISRKSKRLNRPLHLLAFALTGGASAPISAAKAASNAAYNRRTDELQRRSEAADRGRQWSDADHERALRAGREAMRRLSEGKS